jgi:hypothetical protein
MRFRHTPTVGSFSQRSPLANNNHGGSVTLKMRGALAPRPFGSLIEGGTVTAPLRSVSQRCSSEGFSRRSALLRTYYRVAGSNDVDFINDPDLAVRDLSYSRSRARQMVDLTKGSFFDMGFGPRDDEDGPPADDDGEWPRDRLEVYVKEKPSPSRCSGSAARRSAGCGGRTWTWRPAHCASGGLGSTSTGAT